MTPANFLDEIAQPNMQAALERPDDLRAIVNAILALDALAGILHAAFVKAGIPTATPDKDDEYRDALADLSPSFRVLRDAAACLKHGELSRKRKKRRLVRASQALKAVPNGLGLFQCGDRIGAEVIVIETDPGPGYIRASDVIADSYRMLSRVVAGGAARTDEHDRGNISLDGG